jgi:hypothetical protein
MTNDEKLNKLIINSTKTVNFKFFRIKLFQKPLSNIFVAIINPIGNPEKINHIIRLSQNSNRFYNWIVINVDFKKKTA